MLCAEGIRWWQNFHLHAHERFILRCGRHNATLRVKAHWVSTTQCLTGYVNGCWAPTVPYHNNDLYHTYVSPLLIYFLPSHTMPYHDAVACAVLHCSHFYRATPSDINPCRNKVYFYICLIQVQLDVHRILYFFRR
jgi:hypothetical protein